MDKELKQDFQIVFGSESGKRVLSHICRECSLLQPTYVDGDSIQTVMHREGMRNAALMILTALDETPDRFLQLAEEVQQYGT